MNTNLLEHTAVSRRWNPKVACVLSLGLVFLVGAAAGAAVMDLGVHNRRTPAFDTPAGKIAYFERMQKELNLTPAQAVSPTFAWIDEPMPGAAAGIALGELDGDGRLDAAVIWSEGGVSAMVGQ